MKYIVIKKHPISSEELFIFSETTDHNTFYSFLNHQYPSCTLVSAGYLKNYHDEISHFDQISLSGDSFTLKSKSRPEDLDLFRRLSNGY